MKGNKQHKGFAKNINLQVAIIALTKVKVKSKMALSRKTKFERDWGARQRTDNDLHYMLLAEDVDEQSWELDSL